MKPKAAFPARRRAWFYGNAAPRRPDAQSSGRDRGRLPDFRTFSWVQELRQGLNQASIPTAIPPLQEEWATCRWRLGSRGRTEDWTWRHGSSMGTAGARSTMSIPMNTDAGVSACFDGDGYPWLAWSDFEYENLQLPYKNAYGALS
ncbi:MAG: hypothetical protein MZU95_02925 [Desulfomicrobium escambiense]|nr:hypothetical protein [Desulfomicrobium escambiense]